MIRGQLIRLSRRYCGGVLRLCCNRDQVIILKTRVSAVTKWRRLNFGISVSCKPLEITEKMDNLRNLFGQVSTLASMKTNSTSSAAGSSVSAGAHNAGLNHPGERQRSISGDFSSLETHQNRVMKQHKAADRDSYYYIMWRS